MIAHYRDSLHNLVIADKQDLSKSVWRQMVHYLCEKYITCVRLFLVFIAAFDDCGNHFELLVCIEGMHGMSGNNYSFT